MRTYTLDGMGDSSIRKELMLSTMAVEERIKIHDQEKGDSWKTCPLEYLMDKYLEEFHESLEVLTPLYPPALNGEPITDQELVDIKSELEDFMAISSFLWNRIKSIQDVRVAAKKR
jgi:hypothetical protein